MPEGLNNAFEEELSRLHQLYLEAIDTYGQKSRAEKEKRLSEAFNKLSSRLSEYANREGFEFGEKRKAILRLKLARYLQHHDFLDESALFDAIIESPRFIDEESGSLHRLLEVHEGKTLQQIAEIRRQRAEMKGDDAFNPYEALFTTESGNYYLARLLNMPHLEEESAFMKHCVGTSNSYINRLKRGEIEILSFRRVPKIDADLNKLQEEGDLPVFTIEYDPHDKVIRQIRGYKDFKLDPRDTYVFNEVMDALRKMRQTRTDSGELRNFSRIADGVRIDVPDYHILTDKGLVALQNFDPKPDDFILSIGKMDITSQMSPADAMKILNIMAAVEGGPNSLAVSPSEVSENTKIYMGKLFPEIWNFDLEHIYTDFPGQEVYQREVITGGKTKAELKKILLAKFKVEERAIEMIDSEDFVTRAAPERIKIAILTPKSLGIRAATSLDKICRKAEEFGLELCPAEAALYQRIQDRDTIGTYRIAMKPLSDKRGQKLIFIMSDSDDSGPWLGYGWTNTTISIHEKIAFQIRTGKKPE